MIVTKEITIDELTNLMPDSVSYLMKKVIRCIICGEPVWGTLESNAKSKGFSDNDIDMFVNELNLISRSILAG